MRIIDTHIHGSFGINFNTSSYDDIKFLLSELYKRNIIGICPTLVGDSEENLQKRFELFSFIKEEQLKNPKKEALIIGVHLEGTFLSPDKPGIQDKNVFLTPSVENFKALAGKYEKIIKIVTLAPELDFNNKLSLYLEDNNIKAHAGHTVASSKGAVSGTTHHFNAMPAISHRGDNLALDALFDNSLYCEIIADGIHVGENMLKAFFKLKNNDKIILVSDALPAAHSKDDIVFCGKKINSQGKDEKGTIAGSVLLLDEIVKKVTQCGIINKETAKKAVFDNPIKHLNLDDTQRDYLSKI